MLHIVMETLMQLDQEDGGRTQICMQNHINMFVFHFGFFDQNLIEFCESFI